MDSRVHVLHIIRKKPLSFLQTLLENTIIARVSVLFCAGRHADLADFGQARLGGKGLGAKYLIIGAFDNAFEWFRELAVNPALPARGGRSVRLVDAVLLKSGGRTLGIRFITYANVKGLPPPTSYT